MAEPNSNGSRVCVLGSSTSAWMRWISFLIPCISVVTLFELELGLMALVQDGKSLRRLGIVSSKDFV